NLLDPDSLPAMRARRGEGASELLVRFRPRAGGTDQISLSRALPLTDDTGNFELVLSLFRAVTDEQLYKEAQRARAEAEASAAVRLGVGLSGRVAASRTAWRIDDLEDAPSVAPLLRERCLRSVIAAPLVVEDRVIGVVHADSREVAHFGQDDLRLLELIADRV